MTATTGTVSGVGDLLADRVSRAPAETAVVSGGTRLSYAELATRSDELAARLADRGVGLESRVGLLVERGVDLVVAVFAVLKAGAAYVPVDPAHPAPHRAALLAAAGAGLVVTQPELAGEVPPECEALFVAAPGDGGGRAVTGSPAEGDAGWLAAPGTSGERAPGRAVTTTPPTDGSIPPRPRVRPNNLAYVLHTSGSTGRPRGVLGTHHGLLSLFAAHRAQIFEPAARAAGRRLRVAHTASLSFDAS